ncbi:glutathione S-transferase II [Xylariaceae sp. FL0594]|nr:glutathione S-transferase II [Xylariaceae sp. FL0594]
MTTIQVILLLEELEVPCTIKWFDEIEKKPFTDLNPNGRVPAIVDPNRNRVLWETGAILTYLVEQYDTEKRLTFDSIKEKRRLKQWMYFQASEQGPYCGQAGWSNVHHPETLQSSMDRYNNEARRALGVLDASLQGKEWLVGGKMTFVDIALAPWNDRIDATIQCAPEDKLKGFPNVQAWHERLTSRPSWKKVMSIREQLIAEHGLTWIGLAEGETVGGEGKNM